MISLEDAARQIAGAWKMALNAEDWRASLDRSVEGVFGSFAAFAFAAPLVAVFSLSAKQASQRIPDFSESIYQSAPLLPLVTLDLATYALDWAAGLALLIAIARATGSGKQAADLIVGYNWIQPITAAAQLPGVAVMASTASAAAGGILGIPAFALTIFLIWGIIRRGLDARPAPAAAILVMLVLISVALDMLGSAAIRAFYAAQA